MGKGNLLLKKSSICEKSTTHKITLMVPSGVIHFFLLFAFFTKLLFLNLLYYYFYNLIRLIAIAMFLCNYTVLPCLNYVFHFISYVIIHTALSQFSSSAPFIMLLILALLIILRDCNQHQPNGSIPVEITRERG